MLKRKIIEIDEDKCDGCEQCVSACHEGAIQMVDGKAKLVSDVYCDGLGDCIGECPQDAITIVEREAEPYDEQAVYARQADLAAAAAPPQRAASAPVPKAAPLGPPGGCPGAAMRQLRPMERSAETGVAGQRAPSALRNWPIELHLVPVQAPYYQDATLLLAADCVPFAFPDFHRDLLAGRTLIVGCPKLDDTSAYLEKLTAILRFNAVKAVEVAFMEVPCCHGLARLAGEALAASGKDIELSLVMVGIDGRLERPKTKERASA